MLAMGLYARIGPGRSGMGADADTVAVQAAARAHTSDMRPGMHAAIAHAGAGANDMANMAAGGDAMLANARARADTADMGTRSDAIAADMGADANAQHFDISADGMGREGRQKGQHIDRGSERFHRRIHWGS